MVISALKMMNFVLKMMDIVQDYVTGGLELHYCLNTTAGCGCDMAPEAGPCVPLVDHHDGTYTGVIDGRTVSPLRTASFRFFQRASSSSASSGSPLSEVFITMWADGSECLGGAADKSFQSHGGDCFRDVVFAPDCR